MPEISNIATGSGAAHGDGQPKRRGLPAINVPFLVIIALLVILILILIIRQIRMRNRFASAKEKMEQQNKGQAQENPPRDDNPDDFDKDNA